MRLLADPGPRTTIAPTRRPPADPFKPFPHDQRYHTQASDRVSPPPTPERIHGESHQKNRRQIGADQRLLGFRGQGTTPKLESDGALGPRQKRHDEQGGGCNPNAQRALLGRRSVHEGLNRLEADIAGEGQETEPDEPKGLLLDPFASPLIQVGAQAPEGRSSGRELNEAIGPKSYQGDAARQEPRTDREHAL